MYMIRYVWIETSHEVAVSWCHTEHSYCKHLCCSFWTLHGL